MKFKFNKVLCILSDCPNLGLVNFLIPDIINSLLNLHTVVSKPWLCLSIPSCVVFTQSFNFWELDMVRQHRRLNRYECEQAVGDEARGAGRAVVHGAAKSSTGVRRSKRQPSPVLLPGEPQGRGSLAGCRPWGRTASDTTERLSSRQESATEQQIYPPKNRNC